MGSITLAQAEAKLASLLTAYDEAISANSYSVSAGGGGRSVSRQSLADLERAIDFWEKKIAQLNNGGMRVRGVTPIG